MNHVRATAVALLAAAIALGACTPGPVDPAGTTPPSPAPTISPLPPSTTSPAPTTSPFPDELHATGTVPALLDPELLAGMPLSIGTHTDNARRVFAQWPQVGRPAIDTTLATYVTGRVADFERDYPATGSESIAIPELNVGWHLLGSAPDAIGIVVDEFLNAGGSAAESWHTFWFDPTAGNVLTPSALIDVARADAALAAVAATRAELADAKVSTASAPLVAFADDGSLIVGFDECEITACYVGRVTLAIAPDVTTSLLTERGVAARAATLHPVALGPVASPTPTDAPTTTGPTSTPTEGPTDVPTTTPTEEPTVEPSTEPTVEPSAEPTGTETGTPSAKPSAKPSDKPSAKPSTKPTSKPRPGKRVDCAKAKCIALTFDDGPGPYTARLLDELRRAKAPATFFALGQRVETYPKVARRIVAEGHELASHTWDHRDLTTLTATDVRRQLTRTADAIEKATGKRPTLVRPPYGATNDTVRAAAKKAGEAVILWNIDTLDWKTRSTPSTVKAAVGAKRGSIVLMHDIHSSTVDAVPQIIEGLRAKGYTLVTVTDLLGSPQAGKAYYSR